MIRESHCFIIPVENDGLIFNAKIKQNKNCCIYKAQKHLVTVGVLGNQNWVLANLPLGKLDNL